MTATGDVPRVRWLFSPIRSGSSITVYAAGAALGWPVADEVFGPWDRTGAPYHYPRSHLELIEAFRGAGERLTAGVAGVAERVFADLAAQQSPPARAVICKHPHASIGPEDLPGFWPDAAPVVLMRNPLYALNSLFVRGWQEATGGTDMLGYFSTVGRRWLADPHRLTYERMRAEPREYFAALFRAWDAEPTPERIERALAYVEGHYHHSSKDTRGQTPGDSPASVRSERAWRLPEAIVRVYLSDPHMREVFREAGWPREREAYPAPAADAAPAAARTVGTRGPAPTADDGP